MTTAIALMPDWFCVGYARQERLSFVACLLAVVQCIARVMLMPVALTWAALLRIDTMAYELMAMAIEAGFLTWIWFGDSYPHPVLLRALPAWAWTLVVVPLHADHLYQFARRNRHGRAIALIFDLALFVWLWLNVLRGKFYFSEVFLVTFIGMGVIAVFSLHQSPGDRHGSE